MELLVTIDYPFSTILFIYCYKNRLTYLFTSRIVSLRCICRRVEKECITFSI